MKWTINGEFIIRNISKMMDAISAYREATAAHQLLPWSIGTVRRAASVLSLVTVLTDPILGLQKGQPAVPWGFECTGGRLSCILSFPVTLASDSWNYRICVYSWFDIVLTLDIRKS